LSLFGLKDDPT